MPNRAGFTRNSSTRTDRVIAPLLKFVAVVTLSIAVLYPPALSQIFDLGPVVAGFH